MLLIYIVYINGPQSFEAACPDKPSRSGPAVRNQADCKGKTFPTTGVIPARKMHTNPHCVQTEPCQIWIQAIFFVLCILQAAINWH